MVLISHFVRGCKSRVDFNAVKLAALPHIPSLVQAWLPDGRRQGGEWLALNPKRSDKRAGSFRVNLRTGRWADFATSDRGGDIISLYAFLHGTSQGDAARAIAEKLGVRP